MQTSLKDVAYLCLDIDTMNKYLNMLEKMYETACRDEMAVVWFVSVFTACIEKYARWLFERGKIDVREVYEVGVKVGSASGSIVAWTIRGYPTCDEIERTLLNSLRDLDIKVNIKEDIETLKTELGEVFGR